MELEIRPIQTDEIDGFYRAIGWAFGAHSTEEQMALDRPFVVPERSVAVFDNGDVAAGALWLPLDMVVPGGTLSMAGVTGVAVQPTHRRRGLLTRMMERQLTELHEKGIPLAGLFASESVIYGRFGYGPASFHERWSIDRQHTAYVKPLEAMGRLSFVQPGHVKGVFPEIERRALAARPGSVKRPEAEWDILAADPEPARQGASAYFHVVYEENGQPDGYVTYRVKDETVQVHHLMAATDNAHVELWQYCFGVDLRTTTTAWGRPVDDPLPWMLADPRRLKRERYDGLWLRLVDVAVALSGRNYAGNESLALGVEDSFCPWNDGTYELEASDGRVECRRSKKSPDLVLSSADLAATYLGTVAFSTLARAGRVEERTPGALDRADSLFAHRPRPWSPYTF